MENQPTKLDKAVKVSIAVGIMIVALSIAYYMVIFLPQKTKRSAALLESCLHSADEVKFKDWNRACALQKLDNECSLPVVLSDNVNEEFENNRDMCFRKYPQ